MLEWGEALVVFAFCWDLKLLELVLFIFGFEIEFEMKTRGFEIIDVVIRPAEDDEASMLEPDVICGNVATEELAAEHVAAFAITECDWVGMTVDRDAEDAEAFKNKKLIWSKVKFLKICSCFFLNQIILRNKINRSKFIMWPNRL